MDEEYKPPDSARELLYRYEEGERYFFRAKLAGADLRSADLRDADLHSADLRDANLTFANMEGAYFESANMESAYFGSAILKGAKLFDANLKGAKFLGTNLRGADFTFSIVNGETLIDTELVDEKTNFNGVGLEATRIRSGVKQLLAYNVRRKNWQEWYEQNKGLKRILNAFVRLFWWVSDYGRSTPRIIGTFFILSFVFAFIYWGQNLLGFEVIKNLDQGESQGLLFVRSVYFSIVTMTTLGFGDMHAHAQSYGGHIMLTVQVLLGYVMLGVLITRFAVLFSTDGPSAKFSEP